MKKLSFVSMFLLILFTATTNGQNNCKVLLKEIAESYEGDCKNGLANGKGQAKGTDEYKGEFKKGFPHGKGVYKWGNGDIYEGNFRKGLKDGYGELSFKSFENDSVLTGYWKNNKYIGKSKNDKGYKVIWKNNIQSTSFRKTGEGNSIKIIIQKQGTKFDALDLVIQNSSGIYKKYSGEIIIEDVEFPFEGNLRFSMPNQMNTVKLDCEITFNIEQKGYWLVYIRN